ncbi:MAG TPA: hypothetical protein PKK10_16635 [Woeseiaceae bacterium]|nr:hypothetical protein [Woeseiaceae bacterium]
MSNTSSATAEARPFDEVLKASPELQDQATLDGMSELITKVAPLLQGNRLHNIVDLLAAISDVIEMSDDAMLQKLMAFYEDGVASVWSVSNALRYSSAQAAQADTPPTMWQSIRRLRGDEDARRGLDMTIRLMSELGRQSRAAHRPITED